MQEWRDQTRIPRGMSDFQRWFRPQGINPRVGMSDIDGILHTLNGNRFLMFEFKPDQGELTTGQRITMEGFSKLPGCTALAIFDPYWDDTSRTKYTDDEVLRYIKFKEGKRTEGHMTVAQLNESIANWFNYQ